MRVIGLTGGICSGKSSCTEYLSDTHGLPVIDCDRLGHQSYRSGTECFRTLVATFGQGIVGGDGEVNRRELGRIVFSARDEMLKLQRIVWPEIAALIRQRIQDAQADGTEVLVFEAAVLLEAGWNDQMTEVWVLECDPQVALQRLIDRNGCTEDKAREIMSNQMSNADRRAHATRVINTNCTRDEMYAQLEEALRNE